MKRLPLFILILSLLLLTLPLQSAPAFSEAADQGLTEAAAAAGLDVYSFDALDPQNVSSTEGAVTDGLTQIRVVLQDNVFAEDEFTYQMMYSRNWSTESGILANKRVDLDGDGQEEWIVLLSESLSDEYGGYTQESIIAFENVGGAWVRQADFVIGTDMMSPYSDGPRLRLLSAPDGVRIARVEFGQMDGGLFLAQVNMYAYDGQSFYKAVTAQMDDYSASCLYGGHMPADVDREMSEASIYSAQDKYAYLQAHYEGNGTLIENVHGNDEPNCTGIDGIGALLRDYGLEISYSVSNGFISESDITGGEDFFCVTREWLGEGEDSQYAINVSMQTELVHLNGMQPATVSAQVGDDIAAAADAQSALESDFSYEACEGGCMITGYLGSESVVHIPETLGGMTVVAIGEDAFSGQTTIREVYLPSGVKTIAKSAFNRCEALEYIGLNDGLQSIGEWAFNKCLALTNVDIPASVTSIGNYAFSGCAALLRVSLNSPNTSYSAEEIIKGSAQASLVFAWATPTPDITPIPTPIPTMAPTPVPDVDGVDVYAGHYTLGRSSVRKGNDFDVRAEKAVDGNLGTAWNAHDKGKGEWISFMMPSGKSCRMAGFRIVNGYIKNNKAYTENTRIRTLDLYCDGVYIQSFTLSDDRAMQTFWLSQPVTGREFRMEASDVYSGSAYRDLSITEVELLGTNNEDFHTRDLSGWGRAVDLMAQKLYDGGTLQRGSYGYDVMGLQVLLDRGFGLLQDVADGSFGGNTEAALNALMAQMRDSNVGASLEPMRDGVADAAFLRNLQLYIQNR